MAERNQFARCFAEFLPEVPVCGLYWGFLRFDSATDHFQRRPINGVFPFEDEPDISVLFHREHAGAVFNLNELVSRFGAVWKDDAILAKPHQTPLMNIPAGH